VSAPARVVSLPELAGVRSWTRRTSGECVRCWGEQHDAAMAGTSVPVRRPARWGAQLDGRPVALCSVHHVALTEIQSQMASGRSCRGGRCRRDGDAVSLCGHHGRVLLPPGGVR